MTDIDKKLFKRVAVAAIVYIVCAMVAYGYTYRNWERDELCEKYDVTIGPCGEEGRIRVSGFTAVFWPVAAFSAAFHHTAVFITRWP